MQFLQEDYMKSKEGTYGRVSEYSRARGYGYIYTESGKQIFLSSYNINTRLEKKLRLGTTVKLIPEEREGRFVATQISIIDQMPEGFIKLTDQVSIPYKDIKRFYMVKGTTCLKELGCSEQELIEHGYTLDDIAYLGVKTTDGEYKFTRTGSRIKANGQLDSIVGTYVQLKNLFLKL